ncbi:MAG: type I restriction endonuclease subunit R, partial [Spirochaetes bacterium]|nr:type I restriction endonuclease subunit R [Spirochaetota bacterium]
SQGGRTSAAVSMALGTAGAEEDDESIEDKINRLMEAKKLLPNASYFAFTATPKNKTLEIFGEPEPQPDGTVRHHPFHSYTMKQAIQEGFILDVLRHYTPVNSYYKLIKTVEGDPEFDVKRARKKLRRYVEGHDHAIRDYLIERKSPYRAIVAFSGDHEYGGAKVTEASLNGFPSSQIADRIQEDPYRFLICADKFQTGYDEPLLHTMYVDKVLSGIKAVQTLSRLNRAHPQKHDVFVLDFMNDADTIQLAFADYYRTTILAEETDPDKLHDLKAVLDGYQIYSTAQIQALVTLYLDGADRDRLDPILDACVAVYREQLDENGQVDFKGNAKAFLRSYGFLAQILPYTSADWEKLSIFLNFLVPKLPAPVEEDLSKGILEAIDMDSYRVEKQAAMQIQLPDADAQIEPVPTSGGGWKPEPELDRLSSILKSFNEQFGNIPWTDADHVHRLITDDIPKRVAADTAYQNAKRNSDRQNARIEHDKALTRVMTDVLKDDTELFKQFMDNESFRRWMTDTVFGLTYEQPGA